MHAYMDLLFTGFTFHDGFELISLEGVFIVFPGPCLVDGFGGTSLAWASLGHESHRLDTMAHTLDDVIAFGSLRRHLGGPNPSLC